MRIEVQLFGWLRKCQPGPAGKPVTVEVPERATVSEILRRIGVPEIAAVPVLVLVNGLQAASDTRLGPGDNVSVFPPLGGG